MLKIKSVSVNCFKKKDYFRKTVRIKKILRALRSHCLNVIKVRSANEQLTKMQMKKKRNNPDQAHAIQRWTKLEKLNIYSNGILMRALTIDYSFVSYANYVDVRHREREKTRTNPDRTETINK